MKLSLDDFTRRKLLIAKQLFLLAQGSFSRVSDAHKLIAITMSDLAIETMVKAACSQFGENKLDSSVNKLVSDLDSILLKRGINETPTKAQIDFIRKIRNQAVHEARIANASDIEECRVKTSIVINEFVSRLWGISLSELHLSDIIITTHLREMLHEAEVALTNDDYNRAVRWSYIALQLGIIRIGNTVFPRTPNIHHNLNDGASGPPIQQIIHNNGIDPDMFKHIETIHNQSQEDAHKLRNSIQEQTVQLLRYLSDMHVLTVSLLLGLDPSNQAHARAIAGPISKMSRDPDDAVFAQIKAPLEASDAEFMVGYCIDTIAEIERRYGAISFP